MLTTDSSAPCLQGDVEINPTESKLFEGFEKPSPAADKPIKPTKMKQAYNTTIHGFLQTDRTE